MNSSFTNGQIKQALEYRNVRSQSNEQTRAIAELLEVAKLIEKSTINVSSHAKAEFSLELWDRLRFVLNKF